MMPTRRGPPVGAEGELVDAIRIIIRTGVWEYNDAPAGPWKHDPVSSGYSLPSTRGRLLVAAPPLGDPNFDRTVVFMLDHNEAGAIGVVLNRASPELQIEVDQWRDLIAPPYGMFGGGPVDPRALIGLGLVPATTPDGQRIESVECIEPVDLDEDPSDMEHPPTRVRIFHGYAGWGPQQLDGELDLGAWIVVDALARDVFTDQPEGLWRTVLARQRGEAAWLADCPTDASLN